MTLTYVVLAALSFSVAGCFMKLSHGFTVLGPTLLVFGLVVVGTTLQTLAMRQAQMTAVYVMVLGLEALTAYGLGTLFLSETPSATKLTGVSLVLIGIVLLSFKP